MGRWADAEEMMGMFIHMASDECSYMTGQIVKITGGSDM
jgi:NAD(P)-dependent dehydrogenase (short-subunit alcohol dehydrogenase family)